MFRYMRRDGRPSSSAGGDETAEANVKAPRGGGAGAAGAGGKSKNKAAPLSKQLNRDNKAVGENDDERGRSSFISFGCPFPNVDDLKDDELPNWDDVLSEVERNRTMETADTSYSQDLFPSLADETTTIGDTVDFGCLIMPSNEEEEEDAGAASSPSAAAVKTTNRNNKNSSSSSSSSLVVVDRANHPQDGYQGRRDTEEEEDIDSPDTPLSFYYNSLLLEMKNHLVSSSLAAVGGPDSPAAGAAAGAEPKVLWKDDKPFDEESLLYLSSTDDGRGDDDDDDDAAIGESFEAVYADGAVGVRGTAPAGAITASSKTRIVQEDILPPMPTEEELMVLAGEDLASLAATEDAVGGGASVKAATGPSMAASFAAGVGGPRVAPDGNVEVENESSRRSYRSKGKIKNDDDDGDDDGIRRKYAWTIASLLCLIFIIGSITLGVGLSKGLRNDDPSTTPDASNSVITPDNGNDGSTTDGNGESDPGTGEIAGDNEATEDTAVGSDENEPTIGEDGEEGSDPTNEEADGETNDNGSTGQGDVEDSMNDPPTTNPDGGDVEDEESENGNGETDANSDPDLENDTTETDTNPDPDRSTTDSPTLAPENVTTESPPTALPTSPPTPQPSPGPSALPTPQPSPGPTALSTPQPSPGPTALPTPQPSPGPTALPTPQPSPGPTALPTPQPAPNPTALPTPAPVMASSTPVPALQPTPNPTALPTRAAVTLSPTLQPTPFTASPTACRDNEVSVSQACIQGANAIVVDFSMCNPMQGDWIAMYSDGFEVPADDDVTDFSIDGNYLDWAWTCGDQDCSGAPASNSVVLPSDNPALGLLLLRVYLNREGDGESWDVLARSQSFVLTNPCG